MVNQNNLPYIYIIRFFDHQYLFPWRDGIDVIEFWLIDQNDLLFNHIVGFFDQEDLWIKSISVLDFFQRDSHQWRETFKLILLVSYGQAWPATPNLG